MHDLELEERLTEAMTHFWSTRRYLSEGRQWLEHFLSRFKSAPPQFQQQHNPEYGDLHAMLAFFTWYQGDYTLAKAG